MRCALDCVLYLNLQISGTISQIQWYSERLQIRSNVNMKLKKLNVGNCERKCNKSRKHHTTEKAQKQNIIII